MRAAPFRAAGLAVVEPATHELVVPGDFVRLASASPQGVVIALAEGVATVAWLNGERLRSSLPAACLRPSAARNR